MPADGHTSVPESRKEKPACLPADSPLVEWLFARAGAARWGLSRGRFTAALERSARRRFGDALPALRDLEEYLRSLHVEDLALAGACAEGSEQAWEHFFVQYRHSLYSAAAAIVGHGAGADDPRARELADSLYADLFGWKEEKRARQSLFLYFHGRSKLSTWLHAVLAQRHVDAMRASQRLEPLDQSEVDGRMAGQEGHSAAPPPDPDRARLLTLLDERLREALGELSPCDRSRLKLYYIGGLTLAQIGLALGEHESTVSRQLERIRRQVRENVLTRLRTGRPAQDGIVPRPGLTDAQIQRCLELALEEWHTDLSGVLSAPSSKGGSAARGLSSRGDLQEDREGSF